MTAAASTHEPRWRWEWRSIAALQTDFATEEDYVTWMKARMGGDAQPDGEEPDFVGEDDTSEETEDHTMNTVKSIDEARWCKEFQSSAALQAEFATEADYVAFKRAEANGRIRRLGARTTTAR